MIIPIIAVFTILTFISSMYIKNRTARNFLSTIFFIGVLASIGAMIANDRMHFGMEKQEVTKEQEIYSAGNVDDPGNILIYKSMGSKTDEQAFAYRTDLDGKVKSAVPSKNKVTSIQVRPNQPASVVTVTNEWEFKNDFYKMLFSWNAGDDQVASQDITIYYPDDTWVVMSADQSQKLAEMLKKIPADMQEEMTQRSIAIRQLAETDPIAAAQQQVEMIKEQLASPSMK